MRIERTARPARTVLVLAALAAACAATAQVPHWDQSWNPVTKRAAHTSTATMPMGLAMPQICRDDFVLEAGTSVGRVDWWGTEDGTVTQFIIISNCNHNCTPKAQITNEVVVPTKVFAGIDCQGKMVYRYSVVLATPIPYVGGFNGRTWISIAENDATSSMVGVPQFSWSGVRPIRNCPATGWNNVNFVPLVDACDGKRNDLAFVLYP